MTKNMQRLFDELKAELHAAPVGWASERTHALERLQESRMWIAEAYRVTPGEHQGKPS